MGCALAKAGGSAVNHHAVIVFPDDGETTLRAVLDETKTGQIVSSPMEDLLLICSSETDAVFIRCGLALRPVTQITLLVPVEDKRAVAGWLLQHGLIARCKWAALERFEFFSAVAIDRIVEVFSGIVGHEPYSLPLNLWPDVFRPNFATP